MVIEWDHAEVFSLSFVSNVDDCNAKRYEHDEGWEIIRDVDVIYWFIYGEPGVNSFSRII